MKVSRDAILGIGSVLGYFGLLFGVLGQAGFLSPVTRPHLPMFAAVMISFLPLLVVLAVTFFRHSFLRPRHFRYCLLFASCWFAAVTIAGEVLHYFGYIPPDSPQYAGTLLRVLMHIGWLNLLFIIPRFVDARRYELQQDT